LVVLFKLERLLSRGLFLGLIGLYVLNLRTMKPKVGIIGKGNVGSALRRGLERSGYEVKSVGRDPGGVKELAAWGDVLILAVPFLAVDQVVREIGERAKGKVLVDVTNPLGGDSLAIGFTTSAAEELQKKAPGAKVVKAFNTIFAQNMDSGRVKNEKITLLASGDDAQAKAKTLELARDIGFDAVDAGPLKNARWLETLGFLNIQLGYGLKMGPQIGFKLVR